MNGKVSAALGCVFLAGAAGPAVGQEMHMVRAPRTELGLYVGGSATSRWYDAYAATVSGGAVTARTAEQAFKPGYAPIAGLVASYWITPAVGLRLHGAYAPMRVPSFSTGAFDLFDNAGDRHFYAVNTYLYDLDLVLKPFVMSTTAGDRLSSVYLFAGGGGLTANVGGKGGCEPGTFANGACLPRDARDATVGQGTAGAGMNLFRLGSSAAVFGELATHVYDSPVHVGDGWLPAVTVPNGGQVRIADDKVAMTTRLVIGLKWMMGDLMPPAPVVVPPPVVEPPATIPTPTEPRMEQMAYCVVQNGAVASMQVMRNEATGDTTYNGQALATAFPATDGYAAGATWYINNDVVNVMGKRYVKLGLPRILSAGEVSRVGEYQGVSLFAETAAAPGTAPDVLYAPVRPGCEFQPYQRQDVITKVRG